MIVAEEPVLERGLYDGTIRLAIDRPRGLGVHLGRTSTMCGTDADPARAQVVTTDSIGLADIQAPPRSRSRRLATFPERADRRSAAAPASRVAVPAPRRVLLATNGSSSATATSAGSTQPAPDAVQGTGEAIVPSTSALAPVQGELALKLKPAPLEPTDLHFPINLATALRLSDARPLIVAAAQASVWVAEAQLTRAKVLWVPTLMVGADYIRHDGGGPDFNKGIMTAPSVNFFYAGAGADQYVAVTDAIFQPLVARQVLNARQWDIQSAKNDALLQTADSYFNVHQHRGKYAGALYCVERGHDLVERIAQLSQELVPTVEVDRARNMVADLEQQATSAREAWRVHQRQPHPGPAARPPRRGRAAGARSPPAHLDRPGHGRSTNFSRWP